MIPYFQLLTIHLGPVTIQAWGLMVAIGILVGAACAARLAKERGIEPTLVWDAAVWVIVGAMIGARLVFVAAYDPAPYLADPIAILKVWEGGMSMFGGFIGALVAGLWFMRKHKLDAWKFSDTLTFGLPVGIGIGRIGCFLIHDHPGTLTNLPLGVNFPGGARHDLGLDESIFGFLLAIAFYAMYKKRAKQGSYVVVFLIAYGAFRFFADFLRATDLYVTDARYLGLTPAQYLSMAMIGAGIWFWKKKLSAKK